MKLALSIILFLSTTPVLATNYICEKQVTAERIEGAVVSTGRYNLEISLTSRECASSYCSATKFQSLLNVQTLTDENCKTSETAYSVDVTCETGKEISFAVDALQTGRITLVESGIVQKVIEVGQCAIQ